MAKQILTKRVPKRAGVDESMDSLRKALAKQTKAQLIEALMLLARNDRQVVRQLEVEFDLQASVDQLMSATRQAIADATAFDERRINHNFDYDSQAYGSIQRNLGLLVKAGNHKQAMDLSLELIRQGSYQVEMSDEGMMREDIEGCLQVVTKALKRSDVPAADIVTWCDAMTREDRVGFIWDSELASLRNQFVK
ncbi:MAG: hypothetical protein ABI614_19355 [Planctomycetota bacterium]